MVTYGLALLISLIVLPSTETGTLKVQAQPGTEVVWEGVSLDKTDSAGTLTVSEIPPGSFRIVLHKPGFRPVERSIAISPGATFVLSVDLEPLPAKKTLPDPRKSERAAAVKSDQHRGKTQAANAPDRTRKAGRQKGPVPIWPTVPAASPEVRGNSPAWPYLLGLVLLAVVLYLVRRIRLSPVPPSRAVRSQPDAFEPPAPGDKGVPFLHELKRREELLEQGIEIIPARRGARVIDLDAANVREVEDKPQS